MSVSAARLSKLLCCRAAASRAARETANEQNNKAPGHTFCFHPGDQQRRWRSHLLPLLSRTAACRVEKTPRCSFIRLPHILVLLACGGTRRSAGFIVVNAMGGQTQSPDNHVLLLGSRQLYTSIRGSTAELPHLASMRSNRSHPLPSFYHARSQEEER